MLATNAPVKALLSSDDVLPAEGVDAIGDSLDTSVEVLNEQHDAYGMFPFIHNAAPQVLVGVAAINLNGCLLKKDVAPTPLWGDSWGPGIANVLRAPTPFGRALQIGSTARRVTGARAFVWSSLDPTTGVGATREGKWDALVPSCAKVGGSDRVINVIWSGFAGHPEHLGALTAVTVLLYGVGA